MQLPINIQEVYDKATCIYTQQQIETALDAMAEAMHTKLADSYPLMICVLKGGMVFMGNLLPRLKFQVEIDYVHATRYRGKTTAGDLFWLAKPTVPLAGRTVVVVDDILDGGITLAAIVAKCRELEAKAVYTAVLLDKPTSRLPGGLPAADFVGLEIEDRFVFGYGLDYDEFLRNCPGIYEVAAEHQ